jgi:hypothetical protein
VSEGAIVEGGSIEGVFAFVVSSSASIIFSTVLAAAAAFLGSVAVASFSTSDGKSIAVSPASSASGI